MTTQKFASLNDIFEAANEVEWELKEEKVPKYRGISSSNTWIKENEGDQTSSGWNKSKDFKKPYENKPFEGNSPKYPRREGGNKDPTMFPKAIQCQKCIGWGHMMRECTNQFNVLVQGGAMYLGERVDQEAGCEEETQEDGEFEGDKD
ncbi:hypothetical protein R3W88_033209 [Solanum pinnatisectum]|uniref:CCHC-type domain-containing protein n=1 Tax=Solanum pinnatisectum TaxID=50273 RepID=A0AAV9K1Z8_9SOLN|nr:hypothetical protein R3W88_033209 [Solanum pinnatisectum]